MEKGFPNPFAEDWEISRLVKGVRNPFSISKIRIADIEGFAFPDRVVRGEEIDAVDVDVPVFVDAETGDRVVDSEDDCFAFEGLWIEFGSAGDDGCEG
jgi:hypothetical protein